MLKPKYNKKKNNVIFMGVDSIEINLVNVVIDYEFETKIC